MQHLDLPVGGVDPAQLEDGRRSAMGRHRHRLRRQFAGRPSALGGRSPRDRRPRPGRRRAPARRPAPRRGVPTMRTAPKSSTLIRLQIRMTSSMSCSTSSTPMPASASWHEQVAQLLALGVAQARRRLVEQEQAGPGGQGPGELEQPGLPVGRVSAERSASGSARPGRGRRRRWRAALERSRTSGGGSRPRPGRSPGPTGSRRSRGAGRCGRCPSRARLWGLSPVMSVPSKVMRPGLRLWRPQMALKHVVLPAPLGPMRPVTAPASTSRFTPRSACTPPNRTSASATCRSGIVSPHCGRAGLQGVWPRASIFSSWSDQVFSVGK